MNILEDVDERGPQGTGRHHGGASRPHLVASQGLPPVVASWSPPEPSGVVFIAVKSSSFSHFDPSFRFSRITFLKIQIHQNLWKLSV
jgi:hypothetical protein